jgi:hypothetical protein
VNTRYSLPPQIDDDAYCSPWCGFRCSMASHDRAVREAVVLAERLGESWSPRVSENAGWHWSAILRSTDHDNDALALGDVSPTARGSMLAGDYEVVGYYAVVSVGAFSFRRRAGDPIDALGFAVQDARTAMSRMAADLEELTR